MKGQIQQVFIYIMVILVIGFLVLFGFRMINGILDQQCDVQKQRFITSLKDGIGDGTRWGSKEQVSLVAPCGSSSICFVDRDAIGDSTFSHTNTLIQSSVRDGIEYTVFLIEDDDAAVPLLYDDRITTDQITCIDATSGSFQFWLEGLGEEGTYVSEG